MADMLEAIERIRAHSAGVTRERFLADPRASDPVLYPLFSVCEAAMHLSPDAVSRMPEVPWKQVKAMRQILAHVYFAIDLDLIWNVLQSDLPVLEAALRRFSHP